MTSLFGNIKNRMRKLKGKADKYQEAMTFAQAGQHEYAREAFQEDKVQEASRKLVVVGKESAFSREIIDYAIEMAERLSYEIVALNTAPLSCDTFRLFSDSHNKICQDFRDISEKNVAPFKKLASEKGIPLTHIVKFSDSYEVLAELKNEIGGFEFVVSEGEEPTEASRVENSERLRKEIFVYSML
jgi:hypothetical protein